MSFLFKLVLGQKVVHPSSPANGTSEDAGGGSIAMPSEAASTKTSSSSPAGGGSPKYTAAASVPGQAHSSPSNGRPAGVSPTPSSTTTSPPPTQKTAASTPATARAPTSLPPTGSPRPSTPTRTLLLRIEGCVVAQDVRDTLRDLLRCPDLPYSMDVLSLRSLTVLLTNYADDESITEPTLHLLANATDIDAYPSQLESSRRTIEVTAADKRHARDELLQPLVEVVPVLLQSMNAAAPFWSRYYVLLLLQRLEEFEPLKVNQALLAARGVGVLLEALNETAHDNALRNQALLLLTSLTLTDRELQTLLAFDNAFDCLFDLIDREGGVLGGGSVVRDSLTVAHNILRSNKATQKFFREMGCAARLAKLFDSVPTELAACTVAAAAVDARRGSTAADAPSPSYWPQPTVRTDQLEALLSCTRAPDVMLNVLMSVSILSCVLRGQDESEEERRATQDALLRCGLLYPLSRLAFGGLVVDDATRIEAVRVLAMLVDKSKRAVEEWLSLPPLTTLVRATLPYTVRLWPAPRALLSYVCETADTTLVGAGVQLFMAVLMSVPACQERVVGVFLEGLVARGETGHNDAARNNHTRSASPPGGIGSSNTAGKGPFGGSSSSSQADPQCGSALARILLSPASSAVEKYYTAQVFRTLAALPAAAGPLQALVRSSVPPELQNGSLDALVKAQPGWVLSSRLVPSFYNYYVSFLLFAVSGGAASQQMNTAALGTYVAALLAWMDSCPWAAAALVQEVPWGDALLHQARRDGAAHIRLWSAMLIAKACVVVQASTAAMAGAHASTSATSAAGTTLAQRFLQMVGGGAALDTILFDAQASTPAWQHPAACGLRTSAPTPYDEPFVTQVEQLIVEFKQLLSSVAGSSSLMQSSMPLPPLPYAPPPPPPQQQQQVPNSPPPPPYSPPAPALQHSQPYAPPASASYGPPPPPSHEPQPPLFSTAESVMSSADYQIPSASLLSHPPTAPPPPPLAGLAPAHLGASVAESGLAASTNEEARATVAALEAQLQAAAAERASLAQALDEWRGRATQSEAYCMALQREQEERAAAMAAAEEELERQREVAAVAQASAISPEVVANLRENVHLLEEALQAKDEEHSQLVESLNMMEDQLRHASEAAAAAREQHAAATAAVAAAASQQAPPPPPQSYPPPEVIAAMEAERNAMQERLLATQREAGELHHSLRNVTADLNELLLMVAELNEECVTVKAYSSMAPTPARQLAGEGYSASPSVDRDGDEALPPVQAQLDQREYMPMSAAWHPQQNAEELLSLDVTAPPPQAMPQAAAGFVNEGGDVDTAIAEAEQAVEDAEAANEAQPIPPGELAEITRGASSTAFAEATDVLIGSSSPQGTPSQLVAAPHERPTTCPPHESQHFEVAEEVTPQQYQADPAISVFPVHHQQPTAAAPPLPGAPPPPSHHGGLPNPVQGWFPHAFSTGRHGPRYADPFRSASTASSSAAAPQQLPPPPPPPSVMSGDDQTRPVLPPPPPPTMPSHDASTHSMHHSLTGYGVQNTSNLSQSKPPAVPQGSFHSHSASMPPLPAAPPQQQQFLAQPQQHVRHIVPSSQNGSNREQPLVAAALKNGSVEENVAPPAAFPFGSRIPDGSSFADEVPAASADHVPPPPQNSQQQQQQQQQPQCAPPSGADSLVLREAAPPSFNPFLSSSGSYKNDAFATQVGSGDAASWEPAPADSAQEAPQQPWAPPPPPPPPPASASVDANRADVQSGQADSALPPPPPHHHATSALVGHGPRVSYPIESQPTAQHAHAQPSMMPVTAEVKPPGDDAATAVEAPVSSRSETAAAAPPATTAFNPFADSQDGEDDDDGFADLR